ncbi:MAG: peptidoglycan-associated lipoprotein Pal [Candidatus Binatia bacterium]
MHKWRLAVAIVAVVVAAGSFGCSAKKKTGPAGTEGGTLGEEGLGGGSSLERFKAGKLGVPAQGPLKDVHFAFDSYELDEQSRNVLRDNGKWLRDHPRARVEMEGHCDERGTVEYNLALGAKRARATKEYLVALGVSPEQLTTISYGEELPLCHEHDETCWQQNRRVHFVAASE